MNERAVVQVVLCVDTEGPARDPKLNLYATWDEVGAAVARLNAPSFRRAAPDSEGEEAIVSWFILDWTGFRANPMGRDMGHHKVLDRYRGYLREVPKDGYFWHYHHPPVDGIGNHWNTDWTSRPPWHESFEYEAILHRKVLERDWFPNTFRAGGTIENNDVSDWLEQWIPFDYSNRAPLKVDGVADWSRALSDWDVYHPSKDDYQSPGGMKRFIARSLDADSRNYTISQEEVDRAFQHAAKNGGAVLSVFVHDYRDMTAPFLRFMEKVRDAAERHRDVTWTYAAADEAIRNRLGRAPVPPLRIDLERESDSWVIRSSQELLGTRPWVSVKRQDGRVGGVTVLERIGECEWSIPRSALEGVCRLGVAGNIVEGSVHVLAMNLDG